MYFLEKFSDVAFTTGNITDVSQHSVETTATPRMVAGPGTVDGKAVRGHLPWDAVAQLEGAGRRLPNSTLPQSMAGAPPHPCAGNLTNQEGGAGAGAVGDLLVHTDAALEAGVAAVHEEQAALLRTGELPGVLHDEGHEALRDELRHARGRGNRNPPPGKGQSKQEPSPKENQRAGAICMNILLRDPFGAILATNGRSIWAAELLKRDFCSRLLAFVQGSGHLVVILFWLLGGVALLYIAHKYSTTKGG